MTWVNLLWVLLYFAVGWIFTELYELDSDIWKLLIFLGWPILVGSILVIVALLFLFGLVLAIEDAIWTLKNSKVR